MNRPRYLRFSQALALLSGPCIAAMGCSGSQPCSLAGQPCSTSAPRPPEAGCGCICLATGADTGAPPPDGGSPTNGVWGGGCGGPLAPPSLDVA